MSSPSSGTVLNESKRVEMSKQTETAIEQINAIRPETDKRDVYMGTSRDATNARFLKRNRHGNMRVSSNVRVNGTNESLCKREERI